MRLMSSYLQSWRQNAMYHYTLALIFFILQQWLKATAQCKIFTNKCRSDNACLNSWIFVRCPNEVSMIEFESIKLK